MATLDEIGRQKQRISQRLAQLDAERTKLSDQLNDLETAARVLTRFGGKTDTTKGRTRGHPAGTTPAAPAKNRAQGGQQAASVLLSDASLKAVQAHRKGATSNDVLNYLSRRFGMTVRPRLCCTDRPLGGRDWTVYQGTVPDPGQPPCHSKPTKTAVIISRSSGTE